MHKKILLKGLLYGGLWGIAEATLGYILHLIGFFTGFRSFSGFIMYPVGIFFMYYSFVETGSYYTILLTSFFSATIKLSNLFFPFLPYYHTINPSIAIILEGLSSYVFIRFFETKGFLKNILRFSIASLFWRTLFILTLTIIGENRIKNYLNFLFLESFVNGIIAGFMFDRMKNLKIAEFRLNPILFYSTGILTQILFAFLIWKF
uniref:Uncharacterized protein n=1 Tax=candidate division WOR-3 bacterium TaxID=2052148 RepID=A0A7C4YF02_UNCW3